MIILHNYTFEFFKKLSKIAFLVSYPSLKIISSLNEQTLSVDNFDKLSTFMSQFKSLKETESSFFLLCITLFSLFNNFFLCLKVIKIDNLEWNYLVGDYIFTQTLGNKKS